MLKRLLHLFNIRLFAPSPQPTYIGDAYFGYLKVYYLDAEGCYEFHKAIQLEGFAAPILLYLISKKQNPTAGLRAAYAYVEEHFSSVWNNLAAYLLAQNLLQEGQTLLTTYKLAYLTVWEQTDAAVIDWEIDLDALEYPIGMLTIEFENTLPIHHSFSC